MLKVQVGAVVNSESRTLLKPSASQLAPIGHGPLPVRVVDDDGMPQGRSMRGRMLEEHEPTGEEPNFVHAFVHETRRDRLRREGRRRPESTLRPTSTEVNRMTGDCPGRQRRASCGS